MPYAPLPEQEYSFTGFIPKDGEKIYVVLRHHWAYFAVKTLRYLLSGVAPIIVYAGLLLIWLAGQLDYEGTKDLVVSLQHYTWLGIAGAGAWSLIYMGLIYWDYVWDSLVATNKSLISVDKKPFAATNLKSSPFADVEKVIMERVGFMDMFAYLLKIANIKCETIGAGADFEMSYIRSAPANYERLTWLHRQVMEGGERRERKRAEDEEKCHGANC